jgi:hypothetical protein
MPQLGRGPRLALKALPFDRQGEQAGVRDLQGQDPIQLRVVGAPEGPESAHANSLQKLKLA